MSTSELHAPGVRLTEASVTTPFAAGRGTVVARVAGDGLASAGVRDGDHVVLVRRTDGEAIGHDGAGLRHSDLAAILESDGTAALWKVFPEGDRLRLSLGRPGTSRWTGPGARIHGVVVAVLRKWRG